MDSIVKYYDTYNIPITPVQRVAILGLTQMLDMSFIQEYIDILTYGEARDLIKHLHKIYKSTL